MAEMDVMMRGGASLFLLLMFPILASDIFLIKDMGPRQEPAPCPPGEW